MHIHNPSRLTPDEEDVVNEGFREYNASQGQDSTRTPVTFTAYDNKGRLIGALDGYIFFDYLTISRLWVAKDSRGAGVGRALMEKAENQAREAGCVGATLSTYDFQAKPFYEKLGYADFGVLPNNPRGHWRHFMAKRLD